MEGTHVYFSKFTVFMSGNTFLAALASVGLKVRLPEEQSAVNLTLRITAGLLAATVIIQVGLWIREWWPMRRKGF